ncbi:hypothetical protein [Hymenobacter jejuensis]|uniref:hypothetical protein n=1 Tax=Hymenobacter jejuensis TaxID=2502781 RepID=UPI0013FD0EF6|nr:hypothetical protein [Hymenobacter jejuensis]
MGFPKDYVLHNTFASGATSQTFRGKLWMQFYCSLYVGGADLPLTQQDLIEGFEVVTSQPVPVLKATMPSAALRERYLNPKAGVKPVAVH